MRIDITATPEQLGHILDSMEGYCDGCPSRILCRHLDAHARALGHKTSGQSCRQIIAASFRLHHRNALLYTIQANLRLCRVAARGIARAVRAGYRIETKEARRRFEQWAAPEQNPAKGVKAPPLPTKTINTWARKKEGANGGN